MRIKNFLVTFLVLIGVSVGLISLYLAALSGIMSKMGLVGGDFSQSINVNELARQLLTQSNETNCGIWQVGKKVPTYLASSGLDKVVLSGELGGQRIICGVRLVQNSNVERGVYTIIKGLYYLKSHYAEMKTIVERDKNKCELLVVPTYEGWVEGYLRATDGRVHELVLNVYKEVEAARVGVEELCIE